MLPLSDLRKVSGYAIKSPRSYKIQFPSAPCVYRKYRTQVMSNAHRCLLLGKSIYHLKIWPSSLRNSWLRAIYRHPILINLLVSCTIRLTPKIMSGEQTVIKLKVFLLYCLLTVIVFELQYQTLLSATFSIVTKQKWIKMKINLKGDGREGVALDSKEKKKKKNQPSKLMFFDCIKSTGMWSKWTRFSILVRKTKNNPPKNPLFPHGCSFSF